MTVKHGANIFDLSKDLGLSKDSLLDFSSNINPFGASEKAQEAVKENIHMVSMYPDPEYKELKASIASYCQCNSNNIILGSGATELISSFIKTISPQKALLLSPSYSEYEKELNKNNCITEKLFATKENDFVINVDELINSINQSAYDLVIICNPNNPTGFAFTSLQIEKILKNTNSFIMIDETYIEFTDLNAFSSSKLIDKYKKLFVIRGTSKFFSTPGIRLGYALSSQKELKNDISKNIDLWNINIFATLMGEIMFKDTEYIKNTYIKLEKERNFLLDNLKKFSSLKVFNSYGNFILCEIKDQSISATELYNKLLSKGIIIRNCSSFPTLSDYFFRVCVLKPEHNALLIDSLKELLN